MKKCVLVAASATDNNTEALGLRYLASVCRNNGFTPEVLDTGIASLEPCTLAEMVQGFTPHVVAVSLAGYGVGLAKAIQATRLIRERAKPDMLVIGGYAPTLMPVEMLDATHADVAVMGEGEIPFRHLLLGSDWRSVPGLVFESNRSWVSTGHSGVLENLDELDFPLRSTTMVPETYISSSRGCYVLFNQDVLWRSRPTLEEPFTTERV